MNNIFLDIEIENNIIERIMEVNFLGLTINETMTWPSPVGKIASKIDEEQLAFSTNWNITSLPEMLGMPYIIALYLHIYISVSYPGDLRISESINCRKGPVTKPPSDFSGLHAYRK